MLRQRSRSARVVAVLLVMLLAAWVSGCSRPATSQYPNKPIELVVAFAPGGAVDLMARALEDVEKKHHILKQPFTIVHKPGGNAAVGMTYVAQKAGDPYVLMLNTPTTVITPLEGKSKVTNKDLTMIARLVLDDYAIFVRADSPWKDIKALIEEARQAPGRLKFSGNATGSPAHVITGLLQKDQGIKVTYVPFDSQGEALTNLLGGHVDVLVGSLSSSLGPQVKGGTLRMLGAASERRIKSLSEIPTLSEQGVKVTFTQWRGVAGPKNLPPDVVKLLESAFKKMTETPEWQAYLEKSGLTDGFLGSAEFTRFEAQETKFYQEILPQLK